MTDFRKGDIVKVTVQGTVDYVSEPNGGLDVTLPDGITISVPRRDAELVERGVEVFKIGDVVRHKDNGIRRLIVTDGWVNLETNRHYPGSFDDFTSAEYERVELVEKPF